MFMFDLGTTLDVNNTRYLEIATLNPLTKVSSLLSFLSSLNCFHKASFHLQHFLPQSLIFQQGVNAGT